MKIVDILSPDAIVPEMRATSKLEALEELTKVLHAAHPEIDPARLVEVLLEREELGSTAIGEGIAIPHGKLPGVTNVIAAFGRSPRGIDFESLDGGPTRLFFLLVAPEDSAGVHLKALARVSRLLKDKTFRDRLFAATLREDLAATIKAEDDKYSPTPRALVVLPCSAAEPSRWVTPSGTQLLRANRRPGRSVVS